MWQCGEGQTWAPSQWPTHFSSHLSPIPHQKLMCIHRWQLQHSYPRTIYILQPPQTVASGKEAYVDPENGFQIIWTGNPKSRVPEGWSTMKGADSKRVHPAGSVDSFPRGGAQSEEWWWDPGQDVWTLPGLRLWASFQGLGFPQLLWLQWATLWFFK